MSTYFCSSQFEFYTWYFRQNCCVREKMSMILLKVLELLPIYVSIVLLTFARLNEVRETNPPLWRQWQLCKFWILCIWGFISFNLVLDKTITIGCTIVNFSIDSLTNYGTINTDEVQNSHNAHFVLTKCGISVFDSFYFYLIFACSLCFVIVASCRLIKESRLESADSDNQKYFNSLDPKAIEQLLIAVDRRIGIFDRYLEKEIVRRQQLFKLYYATNKSTTAEPANLGSNFDAIKSNALSRANAYYNQSEPE